MMLDTTILWGLSKLSAEFTAGVRTPHIFDLQGSINVLDPQSMYV